MHPMFEIPQLTLLQKVGIVVMFAISAYLLSRMLNREEDKIETVYSKILNSDECKVKGRFEE